MTEAQDVAAAQAGATQATAGQAASGEPPKSEGRPAEKSHSATRRSGGGTTLALLGLTVGMAALTQAYWLPMARPLLVQAGLPLPEPQTTAAPGAVSLEARLSMLEAQRSEADRAEDAVAALRAEIEDLSARLASLSASSSGTTVGESSEVARLDEQVQTLSTQLQTLTETVRAVQSSATRGGPQPAETAAQRAALASLQTQTEAMTADFAALSRTVTGIGQRLSALDTLRGELDSLRSAVGSTETRLNEMARTVLDGRGQDTRQFAAMSERLDRLEGRQSETRRSAGAEAALVLAIGQLRDAVASGGPFDSALDGVRLLIGTPGGAVTEALDTLSPLGATGVPPTGTLFDDAHRAARQAATSLHETPDGDWIDRTVGRVAGLVTIRRTDAEADLSDPMNALARFEALADKRDLAGAAAQANAIAVPTVRDALSDWLERAKARLAVDRALGVLEDFAITQLTSVRDAGQTGQ